MKPFVQKDAGGMLYYSGKGGWRADDKAV